MRNSFFKVLWLCVLLVPKSTWAITCTTVTYKQTEEVEDVAPLEAHPSATMVMCAQACADHPACPQISWDASLPYGQRCRLLVKGYKFKGAIVKPPVSAIFTIDRVAGKRVISYEYGEYNSWNLCYDQCLAIGAKIMPLPTTTQEYNFISCFYTVFLDAVREVNATTFFASDGSELNIGAVIGWSNSDPSEREDRRVGVRTNRVSLNDIMVVGNYANNPVKCMCLQ